MKSKLIIPSLLLAMHMPASAVISIVNSERGFLGTNKTQITTVHNGATQVSFDATGASKLVVAIGTESGFNSQAVTNMSLTFNGVSMERAVFGNDRLVTTNDSGGVAIFYLDNPFQGVGTFSFSASTTSGGLNGGLASIYALSGTAPGVGNIAQDSASLQSNGPVSTSITTSADNSWVFAAVQNSGNNNGAGTPTVAVTDPAFTLGHNGFWGSQWGSVASSYADVPDGGTLLTPTFNTNTANNIQIVAAEFLAIPEPSTSLLLSLGA